MATPVGREDLRIQFARDRFQQVHQVVGKNHSAAMRLVADGSVYLDQAWRDLPAFSAADQRRLRDLLDQTDEDQEDAQLLLQ
jgi:hypothetical protein